MREFGDWFRKSAEETGDRILGKPPSQPAASGQASGGYNPDRSLPVPVPTGSEIGNAELVTGTAGTGVRTGDEDAYDSFRSGGRDFGHSAGKKVSTDRGQDFETGFDMTL